MKEKLKTPLQREPRLLPSAAESRRNTALAKEAKTRNELEREKQEEQYSELLSELDEFLRYYALAGVSVARFNTRKATDVLGERLVSQLRELGYTAELLLSGDDNDLSSISVSWEG